MDTVKVLKGRVIDCTGAPAIEQGAVVISGKKIVFVGPARELPPEYAAADVFEVENGTIIPGLIDAHVHLSWAGI